MATAFTREERKNIYEKLESAALHFASSTGMKKTTVDELAMMAGISKGAFYSFFDSKEQLFLRMSQNILDKMFDEAEQVFEKAGDLPVQKRAMTAIYALCQVPQQLHILPFMTQELPLLIRGIPDEGLRGRYLCDRDRIRNLLTKTGVKLKTTADVATTAIHILMMTLTMKKEAGDSFDEAIRLMVEGTCSKVFA